MTHVDLSKNLLDGLDRSWSDDNLTPAQLLATNTTEKATHVVTSLSLEEQTQ